MNRRLFHRTNVTIAYVSERYKYHTQLPFYLSTNPHLHGSRLKFEMLTNPLVPQSYSTTNYTYTHNETTDSTRFSSSLADIPGVRTVPTASARSDVRI